MYRDIVLTFILLWCIILGIVVFQETRPKKYEYSIAFIPDANGLGVYEDYIVISARRCRTDDDVWGYEVILQKEK